MPTYYLGACIYSEPEDSLRSDLLQRTGVDVPKLHWRDMTTHVKQRAISAVTSYEPTFVVVALRPMVSMSQERARGKCFEYLLPLLEQQYGVAHLFMESREKTQDKKDIALIQGLRSRHYIDTLRVDFRSGKEDARLWPADLLLGALGDMEHTLQSPDYAIQDMLHEYTISGK
ncbi:hypothetical protein [Bifidobacterium cuniculi]|uniref:hypothetical protein n=1 Tax=Bifidobacterium cuniculi TaxID=1688 RepID=UPI00126A4516|nr:hypothetical protein [Bifidobacterium cuniculi]